MDTQATKDPWAANRLRLDYVAEAERLGQPVRPIVDGHLHVNGERAARVFKRVADLYGIDRIWSQTQLASAGAVKDVMGDRVSFIAIPEYMSSDRKHAMEQGFLDNLDVWANEYGARCVKLWHAPRFKDLIEEAGGEWDEHRMGGKWRMKIAERACELGMMLMTHIADPDTWFQTAYKDSSRYGTKLDQYGPLEEMIRAFDVPWLGAHLGGWPEDLTFLTGLLERHPKLILDTSATKWMIRELSKHPRDELLAFMQRFKGRIIFGSDIVTHDAHLEPSQAGERKFGAELASTEDEAFELYASRYWALRTLWETDYDGESTIADPDLAKVEPAKFDVMSAPRLVGKSMPKDLLEVFYGGAVEATMGTWYAENGSR
ncbi:MAG: hypothetical protein AAF297_10900 [Planctomycetota bacterium]